jgi:hypothetical protein
VNWFGAVQAQDFAGAKWAVSLRTNSLADALVEQAYNDGTILRTHILRPTWHFVTPQDIRWMLMLTAPRVHKINATMYRKLQLDDAVFAKSHAVLEKALQGGKAMTRAELAGVFEQAGIDSSDLRLTYLVMQAELEGLICSGQMKGKQFTYCLLSERAPNARILDEEEALAELTLRYFMSHGPATAKDFSLWSGLTLAQVRAGLELVKSDLIHETIVQHTYWRSPASAPHTIEPTVYLLPNYDEYGVGYADRSAIVDKSDETHPDVRGPVALNNIIVMNGKAVGLWKRIVKKRVVTLNFQLFEPISNTQREALIITARRYGDFLGLPVELNDL